MLNFTVKSKLEKAKTATTTDDVQKIKINHF